MPRALRLGATLLFTTTLACSPPPAKYAAHAAWQAAMMAQAVALAAVLGIAKRKMFQTTVTDGRTTREHCPAVDELSDPDLKALRHTCARRAQGAHDPFERCAYFCTTHCEVHRTAADGGT